ncbi:hypothetical protein CSUI_011377 [Cystoisospora suis]|uniref:Uncharacterized protein n=1 Tax=Cystoisospora suis TaxID=483139 RepID=A0A2C6KEK6_9APIC|nr:hypothetical protein CSUI_011377 [Cystoisospora suis]
MREIGRRHTPKVTGRRPTLPGPAVEEEKEAKKARSVREYEESGRVERRFDSDSKEEKNRHMLTSFCRRVSSSTLRKRRNEEDKKKEETEDTQVEIDR